MWCQTGAVRVLVEVLPLLSVCRNGALEAVLRSSSKSARRDRQESLATRGWVFLMGSRSSNPAASCEAT